MSKSNQEDLARMVASLEDFGAAEGWPAGLADGDARDAFARRLAESLRRIRYVEVIQSRRMSEQHADPTGSLFDPLKALVYFRDLGDREEACWMAFIHVHFGRDDQGRMGLCPARVWRPRQLRLVDLGAHASGCSWISLMAGKP